MSKDTKPGAWMPLYIGDWDGDTGDLDCEQDGAYGRLVRHYWRNGPPRDDDAALARIIRMELRRWRKIRPAIAPYFKIEDGVWRHGRVDKELIRWAEKRERAIQRASAGGRGKAAKSSATSTPQALLAGCTSASTVEEEGPNSPSSLYRQNDFSGPKEVREAFLAKMGEDWCRTYLDRCAWQDVPDRALMPATRYAADKLIKEAWVVLKALGLTVLERAA